MTSPRRQLTPQEEARLASVRENFRRRKAISDKLNRIRKRIGVYSGKGGVGKTTVAVNVAATLAQEGSNVAFFDCDIGLPERHPHPAHYRRPDPRRRRVLPFVPVRREGYVDGLLPGR